MRCYALASFDEAPALTELPSPQVGPGEVLIRIHASSVNPVDAACGSGFFRGIYDYQFPAVLGRDFAGTVVAVGPGTTRFAPGEEVFGMVKRSYVGDGTLAEYVVVPEDKYVVHRPHALSRTEAGAIGLVGITALQCLDTLGLAEGESLFINGATGGVGAITVQVAAAFGIEVIATARPGAEEEHVRALGASTTVDWSREDVTSAMRSMRSGGVDGVLDLVSTDPSSFAAIAAAGREDGAAASTLSAARGESGAMRWANVHSEGDPQILERVADLVTKEQVRVPVVEVFAFDQVDEAFRRLSTGPLGKLAIAMDR